MDVVGIIVVAMVGLLIALMLWWVVKMTQAICFALHSVDDSLKGIREELRKLH